MPTLTWDPEDVSAYLGQPGEWDEHGTRAAFRLERGGVRLTLVVRPLEALVELSLATGPEPPALLELGLLVRGELRLATGYLEFRDVAFVPELRREAILDPAVPRLGGRVDLRLGLRPRLHLATVYGR
jgi:hypothetical protein